MQRGPIDPATQTQPNLPPSAQNTDAQAIVPPTEGTLWERAQDNPMLPSMLLAGGVLLMIIIMFRALRKGTQARRIRDRQTPSPSNRIAEIHERAVASMDPSNKLMVDAEELARRLGAQLDNKAARIELLLEEADRKLAQLNRTLASTDRSPDPITFDPTPSAPRTIDPSVLDRARIDQDLAERSPAPSTPNNSAQDQINERIIRLADDGLGCVEIARSLNQPIGQVELILNLRKTS